LTERSGKAWLALTCGQVRLPQLLPVVPKRVLMLGQEFGQLLLLLFGGGLGSLRPLGEL
jgi:hypothetical protein